MSRPDLDLRVRDLTLPFRLVDAGEAPGPALAAEFDAAWPSYRAWLLREGEAARPTFAQSRDAVRRHLPELADDYDRAVAAVGGGDLEARLLANWCPPPLVGACSIAMLAAPAPLLVRNYDYPPLLCDMLVLRTRWSGRVVLGMADLGLGLLDGVNDAGLVAAIAFGGRREVGEGFGIGIVVRAVLQSCATVAEAAARLAAIPVQMSFNVALLDAAGDHAVVRVAPDRPAEATALAWCANRQGPTDWPEHAAYCDTVNRETVLEQLAAFPHADRDEVTAPFLRQPLFRPLASSTWGTVYTAAYDPAALDLTLLWPGDRWDLALHAEDAGSRPREVLALLPDPKVERHDVAVTRRVDLIA